MMDMISEIRKLVKDTNGIAFEFDAVDFTVWFTYCGNTGEESDATIPITYNRTIDYAFLDFRKYHNENSFKERLDLNCLPDGAIGRGELEVASNIANYLTEHKDELADLLESLRAF